MTVYGFLATNDSSQVLISSKTKNLHFLGKATYYSTVQSIDSWGGIRRWTFRISTSATPVPFFSVPTNDRYAITRMTLVSGNLWEIEVIRSGTSSTIPEVYIFTEITSQHVPVGNYGMQVFNESNTGLTYDSRLKPLVVRGGIDVIPPYDPLQNTPSGLSARNCSSDASYAFTPDNTTTSIVYNTNLTKPIVCYQTVSQTMKQVHLTDSDSHCVDFNIFGICVGRYQYESWVSEYWGFYRSAVSVQQSGALSYINAGWVALNYGCLHGYNSSTSFGIGPIAINIGGNSNTGGAWPYSNLTINYRNVPVILSDGTLYD